MSTTITLEVPFNELDAITVQSVLETLANKLTKQNIQFIGELSRSPDINSKLEKNKTKIKIGLKL